jgi:hypothetical protein
LTPVSTKGGGRVGGLAAVVGFFALAILLPMWDRNKLIWQKWNLDIFGLGAKSLFLPDFFHLVSLDYQLWPMSYIR